MIVEATAVAPEGRISRGDLGIWDDQHIEPLRRIASFAKSRGCVPAIQLAHAGRKASVGLGWEPQRTLNEAEGGWKIYAPSAIAFGDGYAVPETLGEEGIKRIVEKFVEAAGRAQEAGFDAIEIHAAHGYLLHQFLSPLSNRRGDAYGGSFGNRTRLVKEVVSAVRSKWPERLPLFVRLSATDWVEDGWDIEETVELCSLLKNLDVDLVDISSGGLLPNAKIPAGPGFQTGFAERVKKEAGICTAAVGLITSAPQAEHILRSNQADLVLLGREMLRNPYWPLAAAKELGHVASWPNQYLRAAPSGSMGR
jgi:2,4-dienoyl-CoA reductase-like NADH-dependent reductase (Old Yellow Enzyme family)